MVDLGKDLRKGKKEEKEELCFDIWCVSLYALGSYL